MMSAWIGYRWLAHFYGITPVQPFRIDSKIAGSPTTVKIDGYIHHSYPHTMRPANTFRGHLTFALKHEGIHLEFLARLYAILPPIELENWLNDEPTGQYSRRAAFFYEWLTHSTLNFSGVKQGNYVDALDEKMYLTASTTQNNTRWRIRDNLPGTRDYCPMVFKTESIKVAEHYNFAERLNALELEFGADLLMRSAVWLTIKESRASFAIEHQEKQIDRIQRFAAVMEHRCGQSEHPLNEQTLAELQQDILGANATRYGFRQSPVFIGETNDWLQVVHYIAPAWDDVPKMLSGLAAVEQRTRGQAPVVRAAVLSFGFVYIHPLSDGNGRVSRFLVNDILRRDGAVPAPFILPISATITNTAVKRQGYDQILEIVSKPFMQHYQTQYQFGVEQIAEDGVRYNLVFDAYQDANYVWRYLDLTDHVEYLAHIVDLTIEHEMRKEATYLRNLRQARNQVKEFLDGPDVDIDRIIRSVRDNAYVLSNKLKHEFPQLNDDVLAAKIIHAIQAAFAN
jgi:hypothetical protein